MTIKDFIKYLKQFDQDLTLVFAVPKVDTDSLISINAERLWSPPPNWNSFTLTIDLEKSLLNEENKDV